MEKNSKVAIVTGASRRIGRAVAKRLARDEQRFGEVLSDVRTIHRVEGVEGLATCSPMSCVVATSP
jgi:NAD(P)-dependent dehydrogenase (short-subunit alcohol dehydrogenase family)